MAFEQSANTYLFVYGTLLSEAGHPMGWQLRSGAEFVARARLNGSLYLVESPAARGGPSPYPACVPSDDPRDTVHGELYAIRDASILDALDIYEECGPAFPEPREYVRQMAGVQTDDGQSVLAWVYFYNRPLSGLRRIDGGMWPGTEPL
jgi:gamma-glutamylcyclotransferase (GGCT)/AIG2-like uncharacterized protein YtfP